MDAGQPFQAADGVPVAGRQAAVQALHQLPHRGGPGLAAGGAGVLHRGDHAGRRQEGAVVPIHHRGEIRFPLGRGDQVGERPLLLPCLHIQLPGRGSLARHIAFAVQLPPHRLDHPQAHDVFQVAVAAPGPSLVGEVLSPAGLGGDGGGVLHPQQRPGAAGEVHCLAVPCGHRQKGRPGVVGDRQHHLGLKACLPGYAGRQGA